MQSLLKRFAFTYGTRKHMKPPLKVAITGAAGQIGYQLVYRIANGDMLGKDQPLKLSLIQRTSSLNSVKGVAMELNDCAFPLIQQINCTDNQEEGFKNADYVILIGSARGRVGMVRYDFLKLNSELFVEHAHNLSKSAKHDTKVLVVANPCNTNALILTHNIDEKKLNYQNIAALTMLDQNRTLYFLGQKLGVHSCEIDKVGVFGNHSSTMIPYIHEATFKGEKVMKHVSEEWIKQSLLSSVSHRAFDIIKARGNSAAGSTASAIIDQIRDWHFGTNGKWSVMGIYSDGSYGIPKGLNSSFPVTIKSGKVSIVPNLPMTDFYKPLLDATVEELIAEKKAIADSLK